MDRRKETRIPLADKECVFRQCDINVATRKKDCDALIEDITRQGARMRLQAGEGFLKKGDQVFIRGCVFNDMIGFLSSTDCTVVWTRGDLCGLCFESPLELDQTDFFSMVSTDSALLADYS